MNPELARSLFCMCLMYGISMFFGFGKYVEGCGRWGWKWAFKDEEGWYRIVGKILTLMAWLYPLAVIYVLTFLWLIGEAL